MLVEPRAVELLRLQFGALGGGGGGGGSSQYTPRYRIQMRVHNRYCSAQSRSAKQKSKKRALQ